MDNFFCSTDKNWILASPYLKILTGQKTGQKSIIYKSSLRLAESMKIPIKAQHLKQRITKCFKQESPSRFVKIPETQSARISALLFASKGLVS